MLDSTIQPSGPGVAVKTPMDYYGTDITHYLGIKTYADGIQDAIETVEAWQSADDGHIENILDELRAKLEE